MKACINQPQQKSRLKIPESDKSGELEKLLDKADDDTPAQVYRNTLDMKPFQIEKVINKMVYDNSSYTVTAIDCIN